MANDETKKDLLGEIVERREARCGIGVNGMGVTLSLGDKMYVFDPDTADQMSAALRQYALEFRNGGRLS